MERVRRAAYVAYAALVAYIVLTHGVPTDRLALAALIIGGLLLTSIGRGWRQSLRVLLDWLPFTAVLLVYDRTRAVVDSLGIPLHERDIVHAERWLFGGDVPTVWLQQRLYDAQDVHWYDALCTLVYTSHFVVTPVLAAVLWLRNRSLWIGYISRVIVLSVAGLISYCAFPEAPPWLAARDGFTAPVARLSARGWIWLHAGGVHDALSTAQHGDGANPVAAMPSLHEAFAVLAALFVARHVRSRWRYLLALYPIAMGYALVYTGEHWVLDLLVGAVYALAAYVAVSWWEGRRDRSHRVESGTAASPSEPETAVGRS